MSKKNNKKLVQDGLELVHQMLGAYIVSELRREFGVSWWNMLKQTLSDQSYLFTSESNVESVLDLQNCLRVFDREWNSIFRSRLSLDYRTWAKELMGVRNKIAHLGLGDYPENDTWRALDTMSRLSDGIDSSVAEKINAMLREFRYGSEAGSLKTEMTAGNENKKKEGILNHEIGGLPSWREVIKPHPDVAEGRYKNAEFAADLAQVARGEGSFEYRDPIEFFSRTYVTEGMKGLLMQALKRVSGADGEPVVQLKTAFGGGKTHSMLALYHMMRTNVAVSKLPALKPILDEVGLNELPKCNVAVLVGTAIDPTKSRRRPTLPGVSINTLWGEMVAQLAEAANDPSLYDYIKEADKKGVSPGSETFTNIFNKCGPCLVLMDELVAYAKKLYGRDDLVSGTFDNFITFIQEVTEAARASKNSIVVASIPESVIEIGGVAGQETLKAIEHTFGRMESIWKPVSSTEGFEVVRRRLFLNCEDEEARDKVCSAFSSMYVNNTHEFPLSAREGEYFFRMKSCYPIHPEVFDRLYEDWATLERFQRTRGVLRLMAAVIHELWMGNDKGAMIMPGSLNLDVPQVRDELTRHLDDGWNAIVDSEVDGKNSTPRQLDREYPNFGQSLACRRVARAIMLGSAPTAQGQSVRGIEKSRVRLGVVQPGENIPNFNDALSKLQDKLSYLYTNAAGDRLWYDTRPTLRKTVEDRAFQWTINEIDDAICCELKKIRKDGGFAGVHICPDDSSDVTDEQTMRLVVLKPTDVYSSNKKENSEAILMADKILNYRGEARRVYKNTLAFVAPDYDALDVLRTEMRLYLAWQSIKGDVESLNLDHAQIKETENNLRRSAENVSLYLQNAWKWLLVPNIDRTQSFSDIIWEANVLNKNASVSLPKRVSEMMSQHGVLETKKLAPMTLKLHLDNVLWKDVSHVSIKQLYDYFCSYCYLPRLSHLGILEEAIKEGVRGKEFFALAAGIQNEKYVDLRVSHHVNSINGSDLLVKINCAISQLETENIGQQTIVKDSTTTNTVVAPYPTVADEPTSIIREPSAGEKKIKSFYMSADLSSIRVNRDVSKLVDEIVSHVSSLPGAEVKLKLEVNIEVNDGIGPSIVRAVSENCNTLKIRDFGFE